MKRKIGKLVLSKETVRRLSTRDLEGVAGGVTVNTCYGTCTEESYFNTCEESCNICPSQFRTCASRCPC